MTNTQCLMVDPTNARQSRGIWARAVARRVLEPRLAEPAAVVAEVADVVAAPTAQPPRLEEMYAELALRTAGLLEQQHALLDSLERDETEPGRLDQLFAIDHLIAQARRHADSLRLLTDGSAGRPRAELTIDDVLHAAASSVQDYPRVRIEVTVAQQVTAGAAADVVHLVTETLDQALAASDSAVVVTTAREGEALCIEIVHQGATNQPPPSTSSHLVDLLAQRHGVRVDQRSEPNGASVVSIVVPASALEELPQATGLLVRAHDLDEWRAPVLHLAPPAAPRHRRDEGTEGLARRSG